ncbi:MAG TPA: glycosyltransferase family 39 protein [Oceanobacillus sp.]|nr:glycosyltransferase family 39 protein [Oceanobacillus sp.]
MKPHYKLLLICAVALALRLVVLALFVRFPGIADPNHYYNMGIRLVEGHGFTIDYIWQYNIPPESLVHPEEHWMPLTAVAAALPMQMFGVGVSQALLLFALVGSMLPVLTYWMSRQLDLSEHTALFSAATTAFLPEFVLNSVRTDTTILCAFFVGLSLLLLVHGLRRGGAFAFVGSGAAAGFAYLTRSDAILLLPMLVVTLIIYVLARRSLRLRYVWLMPVVAALVVSPWLARNLQAFGTWSSPETDDMMFFTDHNDHYAYGRHFTLDTMLATQTPAQIIGKRLFEMAAAAKMMIETLNALPVLLAGGFLILIATRDKAKLLTLSPALILLLGGFVAYTVFIPYKAQAGSYKKFYLSILPLLLPVAAYALERAVADRRIQLGAMALLIGLIGVNAVYLVRNDARFAGDYLASIERMASVAQTLPDTNADGEIILMTQDPYILRYVGIRSVMFPSEDRETIIEVARRYGVDYLLMPAARPALDPLYVGAETDSRFVTAAEVPGTQYVFYGLEP